MARQVAAGRNEFQHALGFCCRSKSDPQMSPKLGGCLERVPFDNVGFDGDRGSSQLIKQRSGLGMVVIVGLFQHGEAQSPGDFPSFERPVSVHLGIEGRGERD